MNTFKNKWYHFNKISVNRALYSFAEQIQTPNVYIYNINEVTMQTISE